jgi:hypothetical protein
MALKLFKNKIIGFGLKPKAMHGFKIMHRILSKIAMGFLEILIHKRQSNI